MAKATGSSHLAFTMAAVTSGMGVLGFVSKRSVPSLVGGVAFGALYAASGLLINTGKDEYGHLLGAAASAGLVAMMFPRYMATKAIVPSGALVATGALSGVYDTYKSVQIWRNILEDD